MKLFEISLVFNTNLQTAICMMSSNKRSYSILYALVTDINYWKNANAVVDVLKKGQDDILLLGRDTFDDKIYIKNTMLFLIVITEMIYVL